ncbi:hypothetical protein Val02_91570 [Virgisporangium aliadipatigenens]|uniref:Tetratricopeptide repeat protein n=1 Tax=Virgisporangium aliadipatigenens TaxID=741659 RepID=A0A8J4DW92_9ACTN|nr:hypothetical protein [Virgisporangium aliadipatigenens]GIJ52271.1 hypothetical protein Val02_91570 [Virgisporangium aliadipatigenens]
MAPQDWQGTQERRRRLLADLRRRLPVASTVTDLRRALADVDLCRTIGPGPLPQAFERDLNQLDARFGWQLYEALPQPDADAVLANVLRAFEILVDTPAGVVPPLVQEYLRRSGRTGDPGSVHPLSAALHPGPADEDLFSLCRDVLRARHRIAAREGPAEYHATALELSSALGRRFRMTGLIDDLHDAHRWAWHALHPRNPTVGSVTHVVRQTASVWLNSGRETRAQAALQLADALLSTLPASAAGRRELADAAGLLADIRRSYLFAAQAQRSVDPVVISHVRPTTSAGIQAVAWLNAAAQLRQRYRDRPDPALLDEAIGLLERSCAVNDGDPVLTASAARNLGLALLTRRESGRGSADDLDRAITSLRTAVAVDDPTDAAVSHNLLADALFQRFSHSGRPEDLTDAIEHTSTVLADVAPQQVKISCLNTRMRALNARFHVTDDHADLDGAIAAGRRAEAEAGTEQLPMVLVNLGYALLARFEVRSDPTDLHAAERAGRRAVGLTGPDHPERHVRLTCLGNTLLVRYRRRADVDVLEEASAIFDAALEHASARGLPDSVERLNVGEVLRERWSATGDEAALHDAVRHHRLVAARPGPAGDRCSAMLALALDLQERFEITHDPADLREAVDWVERAAGHGGDPFLVRVRLGAALHSQHRAEPATRLLLRAVQVLREARDLATVGSHRWHAATVDLGRLLTDVADRVESSEAVAEALRITGEALSVANDDLERDGLLQVRCLARITQFECTGGLDDLASALVAARQRLTIAPPASRDEAAVDLGGLLRQRYERLGDAADLAEAISLAEHVLDRVPAARPLLVTCLRLQYRRTGVDRDINRAVEVGRTCLHTHDLRNRPTSYSEYGLALLTRYEARADPRDLDAAIDAFGTAVDTCPEDDARRRSFLNNLGLALQQRHASLRSTRDLVDGVLRLRQAITATPATHPDRPLYLWNLGNALRKRHEALGGQSDADEAVSTLTEAVDLTAVDDPARATRMADLCGALFRLAIARSSRPRVEQAVRVGREAVATAAPDDPRRSRHHNNLAVALLGLYRLTGEGRDAILDEAIDAARVAVTTTPDGHAELAGRLHTLSGLLDRRIQSSATALDLAEALDTAQQSVDLLRPGSPERPNYLIGLANVHQSKHERLGDLAAAETAIRIWQEVIASEDAHTGIRLDGVTYLADATYGSERPALAARALAAGVRLLADSAWPGLDETSRRHQLTRWPLIAADAAGSALAADAGQPTAATAEHAVELLDEGRCVLWGQLLATRSDITDLARAEPGIAERMGRIRTELAASAVPDPTALT